MNTPPLFTIGIPTYNRADFLQQSLAAALAQSADGIEIIVSDNASTDRTESVVASARQQVRYFRNSTNLGAAANFENLLNHATGRYFSFLQDDDAISRDFAARACAALDNSEDVIAYAAYAAIAPSLTSFHFPLLYGPPFALDWLGGIPRILDGRLIAPLSLFISVGIPPVIAFRTETLRRVWGGLRGDCDLQRTNLAGPLCFGGKGLGGSVDWRCIPTTRLTDAPRNSP